LKNIRLDFAMKALTASALFAAIALTAGLAQAQSKPVTTKSGLVFESIKEGALQRHLP